MVKLFRCFYKCDNCKHQWDTVYKDSVDIDDCPECEREEVEPHEWEEIPIHIHVKYGQAVEG